MLDGVAEIVGLASARDRPSTGGLYGDGVKIAIIDSGLDFTHEAFQRRFLGNARRLSQG